MTAVYFPDCRATSGSGRFTLEAVSPYNGTIDFRDGRRPTDDELAFRSHEHQNEFRYRLLERRRGEPDSGPCGRGPGRIVWERWQGAGEDSPCQLLVSDAGWSILRTHGYRPEVIAVSPRGKVALRVLISRHGAERPRAGETDGGFPWTPEHLAVTTAGCYWAGNSWPYFLTHERRPHFCWRTAWGQRLLLDLGRARLVTECEQADPLLSGALDEEEGSGANRLLSSLSPSLDEVRRLLGAGTSLGDDHPLMAKVRPVPAAIHLVGVHRVGGCIPLLRGWEEVDCHGLWAHSIAMPRVWIEVQYIRPNVHHALRLLGEEPLGFPTYHFLDADKRRFLLPERVPDRRSQTRRVEREMPAEAVLHLLGSPDHLTQRSCRIGDLDLSTERWEYDSRIASGWVTLRITWEREPPGRIADLDEVPSEWLRTDERQSEVLPHI